MRTAARYLARRSSKEGSLVARNMTKAVTAEGEDAEDAVAICHEQSRQMVRFAELLQESAEALASVKTGSIGAPRTKVEMCFSSPLTGTTARSADAESPADSFCALWVLIPDRHSGVKRRIQNDPCPVCAVWYL